MSDQARRPFVIEIDGDSEDGSIHSGDLLYVDPGAEPGPEDLVLVDYRSGWVVQANSRTVLGVITSVTHRH